MVKYKLSRRSWIGGLAGAGISQLGANPALIQAGCQTNAWPIDPRLPETLSGSLAAIRELGFAGFETGFRNLVSLSPETARDHFRGLTFFGVHIFLPQYDAQTRIAPLELARKVLQNGAALGAQRLISSGGSTLVDGKVNREAALQKAKGLNELGRETKARGLQFAYHNHGPEFATAQPEIEILLAETDPSLVVFLLDAGHAFRAGANIPKFVKRHADRLTGLHLRDFKNGKQVPLGEGDFPLQTVAEALKQKKWSGWVLAEEEREDGSKPATAAAGPARKAIRSSFGV